MSNEYILGIKFVQSSACLFKNGEIVAHVREERFNREKFSDEFPTKSIEYCLSTQNITIKDVNKILVAWNPSHELGPSESTRLPNRQYKHMLYKVPENILQLVNGSRSCRNASEIELNLPIENDNISISYIPHHLCHTSAAYYQSGFTSAASIALDAVGEDTCVEMHVASKTGIDIINTIKYPYSLGYLYAAFTQYLGYRANSDEWKVMGLSPYGNNKYYDKFTDIFSFNKSTGQLDIDLSYYDYYKWSTRRYSDKFESEFGIERSPDGEITQYHMDLACSFQTRIEDVVIDMCNWLYEKTNEKNLCLSGGVAMNSKMNGRLYEETKFENIYVPAMADDGGTSAGACYYYWYNTLGNEYKPKKLTHDYFGPGYTDKQIIDVMDACKINYTLPENIFKAAATSLASGKIIGWFQDRMESGNRALGNRSILADPRSKDMKDKINSAVKHREWFRPFAPAIMKEYQKDYFTSDLDSSFMQYVLPIKNKMANRIAACAHVDGSGRLQTVSEQNNKKFYNLINEFNNITGVPVLLNTSFNDSEPIVTTPEQAIKTFFSTGLDELYIGPCKITKK